MLKWMAMSHAKSMGGASQSSVNCVNAVPTATFQSLVVALLLSRLDYRCAGQLALAARLGSRRPQDCRGFCMGSHRSIWDMLFVSPICLVDSFFALLALTSWWCHRLNCQQWALQMSRWPVLASGIVCQQTLMM